MSDLSRITVLVVEDALEIRSLLVSVMRQIGVGNILRAGDGMDATELMREMRHNPIKVGAAEIDIIISDWVMSPVDGGTLLRWVRRHKESPDPFMPFFIISGYSDEERITIARDLGVSDFIVKPFRIDDIIEHVQAAVRDERRYVKAPGYFGPDRRRKVVPVAEDRRDEANSTATFFEPPRRLFTKVGGELTIDPALIEQAQQEIESLQESFVNWVQNDLDQLDQAYALARASNGKNGQASALQTICRTSHELRGQGGVFGYPLISVVAESLFRLSNTVTTIPDDGLTLIRTHIDLLKAIVREDISGNDDVVDPELISSLEVANLNFINNPENKRLVNRDFARLAQASDRSLADRVGD